MQASSHKFDNLCAQSFAGIWQSSTPKDAAKNRDIWDIQVKLHKYWLWLIIIDYESLNNKPTEMHSSHKNKNYSD